ncbi:MAG TPA: SDR family NAD(P)-dependent oxidoreductase [Chthoniobacterales bacterium]|jgi:NAD(P)-dependent dehydrogenase (short-subunit alcohol dehydrogenase family)|nr:SDR family NAD(P)-dependent oxidoreductase [Chthoniobacterales bacterium]
MKRIFVTGASAGIGLATAKLLAERGDEVWGTSRDISRLPSLPRFHPVRLELGDAVSLRESFKTALSEAGHFDAVINNAGDIGYFGPMEALPPETLRAQFQTLVFAHVELYQLALGAMRKHGSGRVINVTSLAARLPVPFQGPYNAAKAAIASLTMTTQVELEGSDLRIIDLQPGDIGDTRLHDAIPDIVAGEQVRTSGMERVWRVANRNIHAAPGPALVARRIAKLIDAKNPPPRVTVGHPFEAVIAPLIFRFLPQRVRVWGLKFYYGLPH